MVELSEAAYKRLKKDADDNRQVMKIVAIVTILFVIIFLYVIVGKPALKLMLQKSENDTRNEIVLEKARRNVEAMKIEKGDMTMEEYLRWLECRDDLYS
jgi:uncharacterized membrane protein